MAVSGFGLCGPTYPSRDGMWNNERCLNWYPTVDESGHSKSKISLQPIPGLTTFCTLPAVNPPVRGLWAGDERLFTVCGNELYEVFSNGTVNKRGDINNASTPVQFAANGDSLAVASGDQIWLDVGTAVNMVYDGAISIVYLDGYYIILLEDSNTIQLSTDGVTWDPLDTQNKMGSLDRLVRLQAHEGNLWMFGRRTIDVWYNSGNADFPFERISGAFIDQGTDWPHSVFEIDRKLYWLGTDERGRGRVLRSEGYTPVRISNLAIEYLIETYLAGDLDNLVTGTGYTEDGHTFYILSFPKSGATLVYDLTTGMWHERWRWTGTQWVHWRGSSFHAHVFGKHVVSRIAHAPYVDSDLKKLFHQSLQFGADDGSNIRRYRAAPYLNKDQQWLFHRYLRVYTNSTSAIEMRYQNDRGVWSTPRSVMPFQQEATFRRLGSDRDRLYEIATLNNTNPPMIVEAYLHLGTGIDR
jgi:hypothetical protein